MNKKESSISLNLSVILEYVKPEWKSFLVAFVFVVFNACIQLLTPISIEYVINNAIKKVDYTLLWQIIAVMSVVFVIQGILFRSQVVLVGRAGQRIMYRIRTKLFSHIQKLKMEFFGENNSGDLISRLNGDTKLLDNFLGQYLFGFTSSFFVFVAFGVYLLILNFWLALIAFGVISITVLFSYLIRNFIAKTNTDALTSDGEINSYIADNLNNYQVIESFNVGPRIENEFDSYNKINQNTNKLSRILSKGFSPLYNFTGNIALFIILSVIVLGFQENSFEIASLVAFIYAVVRFFTPLNELGSVFSSFAEASAAFKRVNEVLNEPRSNMFSSNGTSINYFNKTAISFQNVVFSYPSSEKIIFDGISFDVPTNSKFAIIGPTGEGKSTIAKLMSGLNEQNEGVIEIFGEKINNWSQSEFYKSIGFILQDPFIFSGSVAQNIVYGNPSYSSLNQELVRLDGSLREEKLEELVNKLEKDIKDNNLDSIIPNLNEFLILKVNNNSQNISQGQKQVVNFMRVLLRKPKILILDEATANLDTITENYLQDALQRLNSKVTQIVIAHRLSTISDADYILSVGGGNVSVKKTKID